MRFFLRKGGPGQSLLVDRYPAPHHPARPVAVQLWNEPSGRRCFIVYLLDGTPLCITREVHLRDVKFVLDREGRANGTPHHAWAVGVGVEPTPLPDDGTEVTYRRSAHGWSAEGSRRAWLFFDGTMTRGDGVQVDAYQVRVTGVGEGLGVEDPDGYAFGVQGDASSS